MKLTKENFKLLHPDQADKVTVKKYKDLIKALEAKTDSIISVIVQETGAKSDAWYWNENHEEEEEYFDYGVNVNTPVYISYYMPYNYVRNNEHHLFQRFPVEWLFKRIDVVRREVIKIKKDIEARDLAAQKKEANEAKAKEEAKASLLSSAKKLLHSDDYQTLLTYVK